MSDIIEIQNILQLENDMLVNTGTPLKTYTSKPLLMAAFLLSVASNSFASTSYVQNPIQGGDAIFANASSGAIIADSFTVNSPFDLESISWWGSYDTSDSDNFIINLHTDSGGSPSSAIFTANNPAVTRTLTNLIDIGTASVYRFDYSLPTALSIEPGSYYLSVTNETTISGWYWLTGNGSDAKQWALSSNGTNWALGSNSDLAFAVKYTETAAVPIPSAFLLMISGILMFGRGFRGTKFNING